MCAGSGEFQVDSAETENAVMQEGQARRFVL